MGFTEDTSTYIISVPLIKNDKVEAVLLNIKAEGVQHVLLRGSEMLQASVEDLLDSYDLWEVVLLASSLSNHQYFHNGEVGFFQSKLQTIDNTLVIDPRCAYWEVVCHWIYFDNDINNGYRDCYLVADYGGCGGGGVPTFEFGSGVPPSTTGGGGGSEHNDDNEGEVDGTEISWEPEEECEFSLAPHLAAQINSLSLLFPCQTATADQIVGNVMQNLCNNTGPNEFISMLDFEAALASYAYVDMSLLWSDPEAFGEAYVSAQCDCEGFAEEECEQRIPSPPLSCESFDFISTGPGYQKARMKNAKLQFVNETNGTSAVCDFEVQLISPSLIQVTSTGDFLELPPEVSANAAAAALNEATTETVGDIGSSNTVFSNSLCPNYQNYFETEFNELFEAHLILEVSSFYGINVLNWEYAFGTEPSAQVGYSGIYVPETERVADWSLIFGIGRDNCAGEHGP